MRLDGWMIIVGFIFLLVVWAYVASLIKDRRYRSAVRDLLPEINDHLKLNTIYRVHLSSGRILENVRFVGISRPYGKAGEYLPFPLHDWVAVEHEPGKRTFIKPSTIRIYEEI